MIKSLRAAAVPAAMLVVTTGFGTPASAATNGTISGSLVTASGAPVADGIVQAYRADMLEPVTAATTEADGTYTMAIPAGDYRLEFRADGSEQWAYGKTSPWEADVISVASGATTTVHEKLLGSGRITGRVLDANGQPATGLEVRAYNPDTNTSGWAQTDDAGNYSMSVIAASYQISVTLAGNGAATMYAPATLNPRAAGRYSVANGGVITVDIGLLPVGAVTGRFTDANDQPMRGVYADLLDLGSTSGGGAPTNSAGVFRIAPVFAASYQLSFTTADGTRTQWAYGENRQEDAEVITVTGGADTVVNDRLLGTGSVRIRATDASSGTQIAGFCGNQPNGEVCTTDGTLVLTGFPQGRHEIGVSTENGLHFGATATADVLADQTVDLAVALRPASAFATTVVDATTGAPVQGACVQLTDAQRAVLSEGNRRCTNANGQVRLGTLTPGSYRVFVHPPFESGYGAQWVGTAGGTGDFRQAQMIIAEVGKTSQVAEVRLDRAGTITGTVTSATTGQPVDGGIISVLTFHPGVGAPTDSLIDGNGRYTVGWLGPYAWPLLFSVPGHAPQWSGNSPDRYQATPITVSAGQTTPYGIALQPGTTVSGTLIGGGRPLSGWIVLHHADTRDIMGYGLARNGWYELRALGSQPTKIQYDGTIDDQSFSGWYDSATSFDDATVVMVAQTPVTVNIG